MEVILLTDICSALVGGERGLGEGVQRQAAVHADLNRALVHAEHAHLPGHVRGAGELHGDRPPGNHLRRHVHLPRHAVGQHVHRCGQPSSPPRPDLPRRHVRDPHRLPAVVEVGGAAAEPERRHVGVFEGQVGQQRGVDRHQAAACDVARSGVEAEEGDVVDGQRWVLDPEHGEGEDEDGEAEEDGGGAAAPAAPQQAPPSPPEVPDRAPLASLVIVAGGWHCHGCLREREHRLLIVPLPSNSHVAR